MLIKVGSNFDWPPYVHQSNNKLVGLEINILNIVVKRAGFCLEFIEMPSSSRGVAELKQGRVDLLFAASFNQERNQYAQFSQPYRNEKMMVFAQANSWLHPNIINSDDYLSHINKENSLLAVNQGSIYGDKFEQFLKRYRGGIVNTTLANQRFNMLLKDRVDYVIEDELTGNALLNQNRYSKYIINTKLVVNFDPIYYMLRPQLMTDQQLTKFNRAIVQSQSEINRQIVKYTQG